MERKDSGCYEAPRKLGLSFSIEEILKRPAERSDGGRREGAGERGTGQAAAAGSRLERPLQDQPQGKYLLVISYPFLSLHGSAGLLGGGRERALKPRDASHGAGAFNLYLSGSEMFRCDTGLGQLWNAGTGAGEGCPASGPP